MWANLLDGVRYVRSRRTSSRRSCCSPPCPPCSSSTTSSCCRSSPATSCRSGRPAWVCCRAAIGVGALAGALGARGAPPLRRQRPSAARGRWLVGSVAEVVFAASRIVPLSLVALAVLGACQVLYYATTNTLLQVLVPARLRGRVMSLYILTSWGLIPIGNLLAGTVAERSSPTLALDGGRCRDAGGRGRGGAGGARAPPHRPARPRSPCLRARDATVRRRPGTGATGL